MIVIAFSGKKDAGKDTGANYLAAKYLERVSPRTKPVTFSFAYPLKKFCAQWFGLSLAKLNGTDADKNEPTHLLWEDVPEGIDARQSKTGPMTHREVLQIWGTDYLRRADPNVHTRRWKAEVTELHRRGCPLVFASDLRFPNEVEAALELEDEIPGSVVRIVRLTRDPYAGGDAHASEIALDSFDWASDPRFYLLNNEGTVADYKRNLLRWFEHTFKEQLDE